MRYSINFLVSTIFDKTITAFVAGAISFYIIKFKFVKCTLTPQQRIRQVYVVSYLFNVEVTPKNF